MNELVFVRYEGKWPAIVTSVVDVAEGTVHLVYFDTAGAHPVSYAKHDALGVAGTWATYMAPLDLGDVPATDEASAETAAT